MSELINIKKLKEEQVYYLEINQPEKRNILSAVVIHELTSAFQIISEDPKACAVVLSGKGSHFCAGGDLRWMKFSPEGSDIENLNEVNALFMLFKQIYDCPVPVIVNVQGSTYGGGIGLVAASDIVLADPEAKFCFSELRINLIPSVISPFILRKMMRSKAQAYMLSAQVFDANEALNSGLIHFVGDEKSRQVYTENLLTNFIKFDKKAMKQTKELIHFVSEKPMEEVKDYCTEVLAERRKSPEVIEKINRFLNKK